MTYRAAPITQRDGSSLANANCRMASIATGLDYHTLGAKRSTGSKMRSYTDDQSGGTDSGDGRQSWDRGYGQSLRVMDGNPWSSALADLRAGRLVHIDVWHATVGGPCLSGSGGYGHTMAIAPEYSDGKWLVADPWCSPPKWVWVLESKLKAGAERWGSEVYSRAALEDDYPADSAGPTDPRVLVIVERIVRRLMTLYRPGGLEATGGLEDPGDTAGGAILYTTTKVQTGGADMGILWNPTQWEDIGVPLYLDSACTKKVTTTTAGGPPLTSLGSEAAQDENGLNGDHVAVLVTTGNLRDDGTQTRAVLWAKRSDLPDNTLAPAQAWDDSLWDLSQDSAGRWPSGSDTEIIEARDAEWIDSLTGGDPWPSRP